MFISFKHFDLAYLDKKAKCNIRKSLNRKWPIVSELSLEIIVFTCIIVPKQNIKISNKYSIIKHIIRMNEFVIFVTFVTLNAFGIHCTYQIYNI
jgi:hypothetical protein